jgi:signal transduction histidine kinase
LERVKRDLESSAPLTPPQAYRARSLLESLGKSGNAAVRDGAATAMEHLSGRLKNLEQALNVQKDFQKLRVTADSWQPYTGSALWWIGKAPTGADSRPLILAVRYEDFRKSVEADWLSRKGSEIRIIADSDSGEPLGPGFPGLSVAFGPGDDAETLTGLSGQRSLYSLSLFFVVMLTFLGAFFLWRDTRRETRIAELRSQFVSSVSHELKTPLTSIRMFAETLQMSDETGAGNPKMRAEYLDTIVNETERLTRLLNNVLDFSRIERGQKNYHMEPALLPDVIDAAVRTMRFPLLEQDFHLKVDVADDIPAMPVDRDAIEQAVLNLLSNAMKYSGKSRDIELRLCRRNGSALIQVSDHGIGIPVDQQRRIFEKFYRAPTKENKAISGTGLGLALVAHIAEAHGGAVEVESVPGEGSTFSIRIPLNDDGGNGAS